jgi:hypothetical protein
LVLIPLGVPAASAADCVQPSTSIVKVLPWGQSWLSPQSVWHLTKGAGVTVAVVDSGVDSTPAQLRGRVLPGFDFATDEPPATDDCTGSGTALAGIVAAGQTSGVGFAGIAPSATILPIRITEGSNQPGPTLMAAGIRKAVDQGASVVLVPSPNWLPTGDLRTAVQYAASSNVVVIAPPAVIGGQPDYRQRTSFPELVVVDAMTVTGARQSAGERPLPIDLLAPGVDVMSIGVGGTGHVSGSGAGYAAAFVAGAAALVRSYYPSLSAAEVKKRLLLSAEHPGKSVPDSIAGYGVVNPYAAVTMSMPAVNADRLDRIIEPQVFTIPDAPVKQHPGQAISTSFTLVAAVAVVLAGLFAMIVRRGKKRKWTPAGQPIPIGPPPRPPGPSGTTTNRPPNGSPSSGTPSGGSRSRRKPAARRASSRAAVRASGSGGGRRRAGVNRELAEAQPTTSTASPDSVLTDPSLTDTGLAGPEGAESELTGPSLAEPGFRADSGPADSGLTVSDTGLVELTHRTDPDHAGRGAADLSYADSAGTELSRAELNPGQPRRGEFTSMASAAPAGVERGAEELLRENAELLREIAALRARNASMGSSRGSAGPRHRSRSSAEEESVDESASRFAGQADPARVLRNRIDDPEISDEKFFADLRREQGEYRKKTDSSRVREDDLPSSGPTALGH